MSPSTVSERRIAHPHPLDLSSMELMTGLITGVVGYAMADVVERLLARRVPNLNVAPLSAEQASQERMLKAFYEAKRNATEVRETA